jgi:hypothetical protein
MIEIGIPARIEPRVAASVHPQTEPSIEADALYGS